MKYLFAAALYLCASNSYANENLNFARRLSNDQNIAVSYLNLSQYLSKKYGADVQVVVIEPSLGGLYLSLTSDPSIRSYRLILKVNTKYNFVCAFEYDETDLNQVDIRDCDSNKGRNATFHSSEISQPEFQEAGISIIPQVKVRKEKIEFKPIN